MEKDKLNQGEDYKKAAQCDPGVATDIADGEKVTEKLVKEQVRDENNNPRNND